jgi:hypothetical protein
MNVKELAKKEPMAAPGFTVITPKAEMDYDQMILERQMSPCVGCEGRRPAYPASATQDVPATGKKNTKR